MLFDYKWPVQKNIKLIVYKPFNKDVATFFSSNDVRIVHDNFICVPNYNTKFVTSKEENVFREQMCCEVKDVSWYHYPLFILATFTNDIQIFIPGGFSGRDINRCTWRLHISGKHIDPHFNLTLEKKALLQHSLSSAVFKQPITVVSWYELRNDPNLMCYYNKV
jgi:hypothetical protein